MSTIDTAKDLAFARNPDNWPRWPLLPLKRINMQFKDDDFGYLFHPSRGEPKPVVRVGCIFMANTSDPELAYESLEKLFEEWRVD